MGLFDKIKDAAERALDEHPDKLVAAVDKVTDVVDEKTGGKYTDKQEQADGKARDFAADRKAGTPDSPLAPGSTPAV